MKECTKCHVEKPLDEFSNVKIKERIYKQSACKKCRSDYRNAKRKANPNKETLRKRIQRLKSKYGISLDTYNEIYLEQEGKCKICNEPSKKLDVDHCHNTMKIRGLLCSKCNIGLGHFKDSSESMLRAIQYLKDTNTDKSI